MDSITFTDFIAANFNGKASSARELLVAEANRTLHNVRQYMARHCSNSGSFTTELKKWRADLQQSHRSGTRTIEKRLVWFIPAALGVVALGNLAYSWYIHTEVNDLQRQTMALNAFAAGQSKLNEEMAAALNDVLAFRYRDVFRRAFEPLEHDVKQTLDHLFIHNRLSPFLIENSNITELLRLHMGDDRWEYSIFNHHPSLLYKLITVKLHHCNLQADSLLIQLCYPHIEMKDAHVMVDIAHLGAFNRDRSVFSYAQIPAHVAIPLEHHGPIEHLEIRPVDMSACIEEVTNAWICASYAFSESDIKCRFPFSGNISCAWQAFPADKYFVHARMLHEYHILATNLKTYTLDPIPGTPSARLRSQLRNVPDGGIFTLSLSEFKGHLGGRILQPMSNNVIVYRPKRQLDLLVRDDFVEKCKQIGIHSRELMQLAGDGKAHAMLDELTAMSEHFAKGLLQRFVGEYGIVLIIAVLIAQIAIAVFTCCCKCGLRVGLIGNRE